MSNDDLQRSLKTKRENAELSRLEWLSFFLLPLLPRIRVKDRFGDDDYTASELERFEKYGFKTKVKQARLAKIIGIIFWLILTGIIGIIIKSYSN